MFAAGSPHDATTNACCTITTADEPISRDNTCAALSFEADHPDASGEISSH